MLVLGAAVHIHRPAPAIFLLIVATLLLLALTGPLLRRVGATEAMKSDAYKAARSSARIETEIELESREHPQEPPV